MKNSSKKPQTKFLTNLFKLSEGLSVLLSILIICVLVLFSVGVTIMATDSSRQASNVRQGTSAYYAAEAGLEEALWINQKLASSGTSMGANETGSLTALGGTTSSVNFKIQGTTATLSDKTVNEKYIIPFPWTGNVPWNGDGASPEVGGCNPDKPPVPGPDSPTRFFNFEQMDPPPLAIEHPCNWGKLSVGEKVTIPLYGVDSGNSNVMKFSDFSVRLRTPCKGNAEFCLPEQRMDLNCWDKGFQNERKCLGDSDDSKRGEVVVLWQINAQKADLSTVSMKPLENADSGIYQYNDSQLYEGKINYRGPDYLKTFDVLNSFTNGYPPPLPEGINLETKEQKTIETFINNADYLKPVLTLSVVNSLTGCKVEDYCVQANDDPSVNQSYVPHLIPYLEYQVVLNGTPSVFPVSKDNIITAEGQAGVFSQTVQVKAPNDNSSLEYVIQQ